MGLFVPPKSLLIPQVGPCYSPLAIQHWMWKVYAKVPSFVFCQLSPQVAGLVPVAY